MTTNEQNRESVLDNPNLGHGGAGFGNDPVDRWGGDRMSDRFKLKDIKLMSNAVEVGHCVIVNECEQPCGKLLSVIVEIEGDVVISKYLNTDSQLSPFNVSGIRNCIQAVTPVEWFGVEVVIDSDNVYRCEPVSQSRATYGDGKPRKWQERGGVNRYSARLDVLKVCKVNRSELDPTTAMDTDEMLDYREGEE